MANAMDVTTMVMLVLFTTIGATTASGTKARNGGGGGALPSLLWMVADDLGYTDLSYKGGEFPTPNLDALVSTSGCWACVDACVHTHGLGEPVSVWSGRDVAPLQPSFVH
jgi:hypothetical protein